MSALELMQWQVQRDKTNPEESAHADSNNYKLTVLLPQLIQGGRTREEALVELGLDPRVNMGYRKINPEVHQSVAPQMATRQPAVQQEELRVADKPTVDTAITASAPIAKLLAFAASFDSCK